MDFSSIYVTFLSMYVSTSTKGCRKCFDKLFFLQLPLDFTLLNCKEIERRKQTSKVYKNIKCQKTGFFPSLLYFLNSFIFIYTKCYSLSILPTLKILTAWSLIRQNLQRQKLNDRKLTGLKHKLISRNIQRPKKNHELHLNPHRR